MKRLARTKIFKRKKFLLRLPNQSLVLGEKTQIMGIVNVTPDSFSHDGCLKDKSRVTFLAKKFIRQGADIIDIGGESSRPGAANVSMKEEINRVVPCIKILAKEIKVPISVDTYKLSVAKRALDAGATIVNNIKGAQPDISFLKMVKNYNAAIVLMHMQGTPQTMQKRVSYQDLIIEIIASLKKSIEICLEIGIKSDKIIMDPGIGFGKTVNHNLEIINRLSEFQILNLPILIGTSRKSFIGKVLDKDVAARVWGTAASVCASILQGAHIVRVHDVKQMADCVKVTDAILQMRC